MGNEISEEENTEKHIQGKSWFGKPRMPNLSNFYVKHEHKHAYTHTVNGWTDIFDILRLDNKGFRGVFMKPLIVQSTQTICILQM